MQYRATDLVIPGEGKLELRYTPKSGNSINLEVFDFKNGGGVGLAMYNTDEVSEIILKIIMQLLKFNNKFDGFKKDLNSLHCFAYINLFFVR